MAKWIGLALLGVAISAAVAVAASNLVSRQIGIASESVSAGDALAPAVESAARQDRAGRAKPEDPPPARAAEPSGDDGEEASSTGGESSPPSESTDQVEDRLDAEEDAREDALKEEEDALKDAEDAREDALKELEDNSGSGSDD
ncbi:MAG TPA: hypothetical protein VGV34_01280 [Solirubrobacterales bacterium]|nr:hypothetical protein [Solirubrobacterales bacterium]